MTSVAAVVDRRSLVTILVAGSAITAISLGVRSTFGLFLEPVTDDLGTGRASFALAIAIQNLVWGLGQPVAGAVADRFGSARVLAVGAGLYGAGVLMMAGVQTETGLYIGAGFVTGLGLAAASFAVVLAAIGRLAPPERRTWAIGVATAFGSVGQFILIGVTQALRSTIGWRGTLVVLAFMAASVALIAWPLRGRSSDAPAATDASGALVAAESLRDILRRAARHRPYVLLTAGFFVCGFHVTFIATHLPTYIQDEGQAGWVAASTLALIGLFNIAGSFAAGVLGSNHDKARLLSLIYLARAVVIMAFVLVPMTTATALGFGAAMGLLWLATVPLTSGIIVGQFGTQHAGTLFGIVFLSHQVGAFVGAYFGGRIADVADSYAPVWWASVVLGVLAAAVHLWVDDEPAPPLGAPVSRRPVWRAAPAGGIAVVLLVAALTLRDAATTPATAEDTGAPTTYYCVLHPTAPG